MTKLKHEQINIKTAEIFTIKQANDFTRFRQGQKI